MAYKKFTPKTKEERKSEIDGLVEKIETGIKEVIQGDNFQRYLEFMSSFRSYSLNNQILIACQCQNATLVKGFAEWKKLGRYVKEGQKAIKILAPVPYKVKASDDEEEIADEDGYVKRLSFRPASVFDISQTDGNEIPSICEKLSFSVKNYELFYEMIAKIAPCPVGFEDIQNGANGYYSDQHKLIRIKSGMSEAQTIKTLLHETTHSILHSTEEGKRKSREEKEIEAEATAYIVCKYFGIDSESYSFEYLASWSNGEEKSIRRSLEIISSTSNMLIGQMEELMKSSTSKEVEAG